MITEVPTWLDKVFCFVRDPFLGKRYYSEPPEITVYKSYAHTDCVLVLAPGHQYVGDLAFATSIEQLRQSVHVAVVNYAADMDITVLYRKLKTKLLGRDWRKLAFYGQSMGGSVAAQLLAMYEQDKELYGRYGRVRLALDCSASSPETIKIPKLLMHVGSTFFGTFGGPVFTAVKRWPMQWYLGPKLVVPSDPDVDQTVLKRHRRNAWWAPALQVGNQMCFQLSARVADLHLGEVVEKAWYCTGPSPSGDQLVDNDAAIKEWRAALPDLQIHRYKERGPYDHASAAEWPKSFVKFIEEVLFA